MHTHRWTTDTPTQPGYYWWRKRACKIASIVELVDIHEDGRLFRTDVDEQIPNNGTYGRGEWWGPLEEPAGEVLLTSPSRPPPPPP